MSELRNISLGGLNEDVCRHVLSELSDDDLWSLLQTCRWLREAAAPVLFRECTLKVYGPWNVIKPERFLPASFRPYIQTLFLRDACPDQRRDDELDSPPLYHTDNHNLCGAMPGAPLGDRLRELPRLRSLRLTKHQNRYLTHGLPWNTLLAILSVPHLREFNIEDMQFCPVMHSDEQLIVDSLAPITTFHHRMWYPQEPFTFSCQTAALSAVLSKLCETLETLNLASEPAPVPIVSRFHWPRLRKLAYCGPLWSTLSTPFISLHSGMQDLRSLSLELDVTSGTNTQVLWPPGYDGSFPWPELEHLLISFPDPRDEVYDHLPSSLRALSLRCWPHIHVQQEPSDIDAVDDRPDHNALLGSTAIRSILRRCSLLDLDHLEIEYRADDEDDALLRQVAATFPRLTSLKIHRYRSAFEIQEQRDVPMVSRHLPPPGDNSSLLTYVLQEHIAQMLAPLTRLRLLKIYLELACTPRLKLGMMFRSPAEIWMYDTSDVRKFEVATQAMAGVFARHLSPSVREVILYSVSTSSPYWRVFDVIAGYACVR
ncbi:uncharacterized protein B0H18DRAFT_930250 [Fomitopsis serialis]|uniref:uncharacterized protein n=1 Tax=Fomitopsis serialis TaxID=139415 RepID=UPI0020085FC4|nr:uncharacterized protein B0H18DRAFT_930250 [Neoantrodia serialis]KAH9930632.1 hypothetical protein B0H18DRAFT_930250 [Neoantrodia serialis]